MKKSVDSILPYCWSSQRCFLVLLFWSARATFFFHGASMTTTVGQGKAKAFMRPSSCVDHELEGRAQQLHYLMIFFKELIFSLMLKGQKLYHGIIGNVSFYIIASETSDRICPFTLKMSRYPFLSGHLVNILPLFIRTFCKYFIPFYWDISNTVFWSLLSVPITFRSYPFLSGQFQCLGTNSVARFIRNDVKQTIPDHAMLLFLALFSTWMTQSSNQRLWSFSAAAAWV